MNSDALQVLSLAAVEAAHHAGLCARNDDS